MGEHSKGKLLVYKDDPVILVNEEGSSLGEMTAGDPYIEVPEMIANAARVSDCWNAMLGIEDPAALMEEVRGVLEDFCPPDQAALEKILWRDLSDDEPGTITIKHGDIKRARALLTKIGGGE
jgi:hypothetical protein